MTLPSKKALVAHTLKFGPEGVIETAIESGYNEDQLTELIQAVDKTLADLEEKRREVRTRRFSRYQKPRLSARTRARRLLGIPEEEEGGDPPAKS